MLAELEILRIREVKVDLVEIATLSAVSSRRYSGYSARFDHGGAVADIPCIRHAGGVPYDRDGDRTGPSVRSAANSCSRSYSKARPMRLRRPSRVLCWVFWPAWGWCRFCPKSSPKDVDFTIRYGLQPRSVLLAFAAGMVITLITVTVSAYRVSKLNIAVAIRGLPEEFVPKTKPDLRRQLRILGQALIAPAYQLYLGIRGRRIRILWAPDRADPARLAGPHCYRRVQAGFSLRPHWLGDGDTRDHPGSRGS